MKIKFYLLFITLSMFNIYAMDIYPQVSAKIVAIKAVDDKFETGDILVKLDNKQAVLKFNYLQAINKFYEQNFIDRQLSLKEKLELFERLVGTRRDLKQAQLDFKQATRELEASKLRVKIAKIELEKYLIIAPFNGVITKVNNANVASIYSNRLLMQIRKN